ncbi:MAG TPA: HBL/NHE enterotoxin family protein [Thermoanaerobaculia bacterium]|jgi:hypothetical protein|nr:HBL/NHE enterotoxin family protein [Thermoanaerobaculia bacterium]
MSILALAPSTPDEVSREVREMQEKLTAYWDSVNLITLHSHSITKQVLQQVDASNPPAWWTTLSGNFKSCQTHAQTWIDTIYPELTRIPQAIIDYNNYFVATSNRILALLDKMGPKPPTPAQKAQLILMLRLLSEKLTKSKGEIEAVRALIKTFTQNMAADHTALTTGAGSVTKAIEDNNAAVAALNAEINMLKAEIDQLNIQLIAALHGLAITVFISYMMMSVTPYLAVPIAVIGVSVSLGFIIDAMVRISKKQNEVIAKSQTLTKTESQGVILNAIAATVDSMKKSIDAITTHIDIVSQAWATLDVKMKSVLDEVNAAREADIRHILEKQIDIETAQAAWAQLKDFAQKLQEIKLKDSGIMSPLYQGVA